MRIVAEESCSQSTDVDVEADGDRDCVTMASVSMLLGLDLKELTEEAGGEGVHAGQIVDRSRTTENEHGRYDDVGQKTEEEDGHLCQLAPSLVDDLGESVRFR